MWNGKKEIYSDQLKTYYLGLYFMKSLLRTSFWYTIIFEHIHTYSSTYTELRLDNISSTDCPTTGVFTVLLSLILFLKIFLLGFLLYYSYSITNSILMTFHFRLQYYKNIDYILFTVNRQFLQLFSKCSTSVTYS